MLVTFNRQTGEIISLAQSLDSFNNKTMKIKDVTLIKYLSLNNLQKISKKDRLSQDLYLFNNKETSVLSSKPKITQGELLFSQGNIKLYANKAIGEDILNPVKEYEIISKYVSFPEEYEYFNIDEVMREYYQLLLEESDCNFGLADNFSYLKNILIGESTFKTIEDREVILSPGNELKLKSEVLNSPANVFKILDVNRDVTIYINNTILDSILETNQLIDKVNISFKNNTDKDIVIDSFMIGYYCQES